jgi:hypothetical protein
MLMSIANRKAWVTAVAAALLALGGCAHQASDAAKDDAKKDDAGKSGGLLSRVIEPKPITVPEGTPLSVTIDETLVSNKNNAGDSFAASVSTPVVIGGKTVIPKGAHVVGRVVDAKESGRLHAPARLAISLASVEVGGKTYDLETNTFGESGKGHAKHNAEYIGGGGAAGALIGGLAGGGKGALIGAAVGAGAGTAGAAATGKKEITIPAESHIKFELLKPVEIKVKG